MRKPERKAHCARYDFLIVGAGLTGCTAARLLTDAGKRVLVIEKRERVGGNIATEVISGIPVHLYGPHIFHTSDSFAWDFFNKHAEVYPYINSPLAFFRGKYFSMPFNMNTFHELWGVDDPLEAKGIIDKEVELEGGAKASPENLEEQAISLVGRTIYNTLIKGYTEKQWGKSCKELPPEIIKRIPLRFEYNNNYFNDLFQGQPKGGYSVFVESLLKGIEVLTSTDYFSHRTYFDSLADRCIYTGRLDEFFGFSLGRLEWRSLRFETEVVQAPFFQPTAVVNFTDNPPAFTRITEHKRFDPSLNLPFTIISREFPDAFEEGKIPFYTIPDKKNSSLAAKYKELASRLDRVFFLGRLATYQYLDMDDAIIAAKEAVEKILALP